MSERRWYLVVFPILTVALSCGCGSTGSATSGSSSSTGGTAPSDVEDWVNNPGLITDPLTAVGVAPLLNSRAEGPARTYAETDGRAKLAAVLKARMNQLVETWSKDAGDLTKEASFSSYVNNEAVTRQFVDAEVRGAVPYRYKVTDKNVYVLMVLKDPGQWTANLVEKVRDEVLQDETLLKTEVLKNDFRDKMDKLRNEETDKAEARRQALKSQLGEK